MGSEMCIRDRRSSMCCSPHPPSSEREHTSPEGYVLHSHLWEQSRGFKGWAVDGTRKPWPTLKATLNSQRRRARIGRVMPCVWFHQPTRQRRRSPKNPHATDSSRYAQGGREATQQRRRRRDPRSGECRRRRPCETPCRAVSTASITQCTTTESGRPWRRALRKF